MCKELGPEVVMTMSVACHITNGAFSYCMSILFINYVCAFMIIGACAHVTSLVCVCVCVCPDSNIPE